MKQLISLFIFLVKKKNIYGFSLLIYIFNKFKIIMNENKGNFWKTKMIYLLNNIKEQLLNNEILKSIHEKFEIFRGYKRRQSIDEKDILELFKNKIESLIDIIKGNDFKKIKEKSLQDAIYNLIKGSLKDSQIKILENYNILFDLKELIDQVDSKDILKKLIYFIQLKGFLLDYEKNLWIDYGAEIKKKIVYNDGSEEMINSIDFVRLIKEIIYIN